MLSFGIIRKAFKLHFKLKTVKVYRSVVFITKLIYERLR